MKDKVGEPQKIEGFKDFKTRHVAVSPGGDYLLCDGFIKEINKGWVDTFIAFRQSGNVWSYPVHLDSTINIDNFANYFPRISPAGDAFFFSRQDSNSNSDIYWLSTKALDKYKTDL